MPKTIGLILCCAQLLRKSLYPRHGWDATVTTQPFAFISKFPLPATTQLRKQKVPQKTCTTLFAGHFETQNNQWTEQKGIRLT
jgi:hypothetical protein